MRAISTARSKPLGALAPTNKSAACLRFFRLANGASDHPINPSILGTPQDAQLIAALDYLKKHPSQRVGGSPG